MAIITKKKVNLSNLQWLDQAQNATQASAGFIPKVETPKIDTNSIIASQINQTPVVAPAQPPTIQPQVAQTTPQVNTTNPSNDTFTQLDQSANNWWSLKPAWPTNDQNMDTLATWMSDIAEQAKKASDEQKSVLKYWAQQKDYQQETLLSNTETAQQRMDRQLADQKIQVDRAIADTQRASERNLAILEKTAALQGTGKSSWFGQWLMNIKDDTLRTITRLQEDLERAKSATGEEAAALRENFNRNKEKIDNDFEYQFRDFTNRQTASIAELTTAWYDPVKVNKALDKIYEEAQYKTQELFTNYVNNYTTLNNETRLQSQELRTQEEFKTSQQKDFISQYIGYNGERLGSQTMQSLKEYLDNGQISQNDYNLYTEMLQNNTIETLQKYGVVQQWDLTNIEQLLSKWYSPTEAIAFMIQNNPTRFAPKKEAKTPNIQTYEVNGEKYSWYFDQSGNFVNMSSPAWTWWATWDLRWLASQYPWQAWAKNNNPWWMTWWVSQWLKDAWTAAWIEFWQWTPRPAWEGNSYISFNTIEDWLAAQWIALSRNGWDINARLQKWVWTGEWPNYAKQVMWWAWLPNGTKFEDLTNEQAQALQMAVIKKESSWLYKLMTQTPQWQTQWWDFDQTDILVFNAMTPSDKKKSQNNSLYNKFVNEKTKVMTSKDAPISEIMKYSMWWSKMNQTQETQLSKYAQWVDQLDWIQQSLKSSLTWPIVWKIRSMNPYDTNAQTIKAQLTALVPTIARGAYGEVWVLTDADVELYKKTIPNLTSTNDLNDALLAFTLKSLWQWYKTKLRSIAGWWFDVSWYGWEYDRLVWLADSLLAWKTPNTTTTSLLANPNSWVVSQAAKNLLNDL